MMRGEGGTPVREHVLVTGGAGYLGSILCEHLLAAGHRVTVVDNLTHGQAGLFHLCADPRFAFVRGDVCDQGLVERLLREVDAIVPLAAIVGAPACDRDTRLACEVNLDAVVMLNRLRSREQLVVFPTTNSGYGARSGDVYCTEETPLEPVSLYGQTKVEAEAALLATPNVVSLRLATVFGTSPRMRLDLLVNHFVYAAITDGYLVVFEKDCKRNYVHIRDVADGILHALGNAPRMIGRPYNLGLDDANLSKAELALAIQRHIPTFFVHFAEVGHDPDRRNYIVSNERLREAGFAARRSLDDGIVELLKGYGMLGRSPLRNV
jgi:nucleoside-diphosphate-sugar epimerase